MQFHKVIKHFFASFFLLLGAYAMAQGGYTYEPSVAHPYGLPNPAAPAELLDFAPLIGECNCKSVARINQTTWADTTDMIWRYKYIMNGMAVQDETLKSDGKHSGSIRQFIPDSSQWYVHYYSSGSPTATLPAWEGNRREDGKIILYNEQKAPNGMDGFFKITFSDMTADGFNWLGQWVSVDESFKYPTWKIFCKKNTAPVSGEAAEKISKAAKDFSQAYMDGDFEAMANAYTTDGKIFPGKSDIIEGRAAIKERWVIRDGSKILLHKVESSELKIIGDYAYDYGYYNGERQRPDGAVSKFKGKYVIVWKKEMGDWKMYLDIWNGI